MNRRNSCLSHILAGSLVLVLSLVSVPLLFAGYEKRPFWTEKSTYIEGDDLFVVGVASKAKSVEEGRRQAFENGKVELMNFAQVTNLEAQGLVIETQMTYEEPNSDGTVNVYRLLRVSATKLVAIQGRLQAQSRAQEQTLEQTRRDLATVQDSLARKQQDLESRARTIEGTLQAVSQLQVMLGEKAQKFEERQRQVEQLLQQLNMKLQIPRARTDSSNSLVDSLKHVETQLDERERDLDRIHRRIVERLRDRAQQACRYVAIGMTRNDVRDLLGSPDGEGQGEIDETGGPYRHRRSTWLYGNSSVQFNYSGVVDFVSGCSR